MSAVLGKWSAEALGDRLLEGRPASRTKSVATSAAVGAVVGIAVYRFLRAPSRGAEPSGGEQLES